MDTQLHPKYAGQPFAPRAEAIIRRCVHCGFCNATCPTYQELGDERDGPRGRIYLIKQLLEEGGDGRQAREHLDRCLTCRSCETTCPSGVEYAELADIGRQLVERQAPRSWPQRWLRRLLRAVVPWPRRFALAFAPARALRPLLPASLRRAVPRVPAPGPWPAGRQARRVLLLRGCVQSVVTPRTNAAAARVLDELGITAIEADGAGCCGALSHHLAEEEEAKAFVRRNLDAWRPHLDAGAEAVVACASGCGAMLRDYGRLMRDEPRYAALAAEVSGRFRDLSEVVAAEDLGPVAAASDERVALHCPCTLTHALQQAGTLRSVLSRAGVSLVATREDHLCCGSAGTYSLLQPAMSRRLRTRKLEALGGEAPTAIVTANVGCQLHLAAAANVPVVHWIELLDRFSRNRSRKPVTHAPATGQGD